VTPARDSRGVELVRLLRRVDDQGDVKKPGGPDGAVMQGCIFPAGHAEDGDNSHGRPAGALAQPVMACPQSRVARGICEHEAMDRRARPAAGRSRCPAECAKARSGRCGHQVTPAWPLQRPGQFDTSAGAPVDLGRAAGETR